MKIETDSLFNYSIRGGSKIWRIHVFDNPPEVLTSTVTVPGASAVSVPSGAA